MQGAMNPSVPPGDIYLALRDRVRDYHWITVLKALEVFHELMMNPDCAAFPYLAVRPSILSLAKFKAKVVRSGLISLAFSSPLLISSTDALLLSFSPILSHRNWQGGIY